MCLGWGWTSLAFLFSCISTAPHSTIAMASLSRSFAVASRSYVNAPASAPALKKILNVSAGSVTDHHDQPGKPLVGSSIKQRSAGGLINQSAVNGKDTYTYIQHEISL